MATTKEIAAMAIARARDKADSAAAFDYHIAVHGIGNGLFSELGSEVYLLANAANLGRDGLPQIPSAEAEEHGMRLCEQLLPELKAYEKRCRDRQYSGWSNASGGPIRYAGK